MIHAFLAGFAGCIGVLVACWMWARIAAWRGRRRLIAEERRFWRRIRQQEQQAIQEQRRLTWARKRRAVHDWFWLTSCWARGAVIVLWFTFLLGGVVAVFTT